MELWFLSQSQKTSRISATIDLCFRLDRSFVSSERSSVLCTTLAKETVAFLPFELQYSLLRSTKYEVLRSISDCCLIKRGATR
jgi:hypothetical protein